MAGNRAWRTSSWAATVVQDAAKKAIPAQRKRRLKEAD